MGFAKFMAGTTGRLVRIIAGVALIVIGVGVIGTSDPLGIILAAVGVLPILAGVFNVCLIAPLIGAPFSGKQALEK